MAEDNDLYRSSIAAVLQQTPGMVCPVAAASCEEALTHLESGAVPDIVLMDIGLPGMSGLDGLRRFKAATPTARLIMLIVQAERETVFEAICAGASGYLLKPTGSEEIVQAIRDVKNGAAPINAYIAGKLLDMFTRLFVSYHTIDTHIRNIYEKLHVHSRTGAVAKALKERIV